MKVMTLQALQVQRVAAERACVDLQHRALVKTAAIMANPKANKRIAKKARQLSDRLDQMHVDIANQLRGVPELDPESRPLIVKVVLRVVRKAKIPTRGLHGMLSSQLAYRMF